MFVVRTEWESDVAWCYIVEAYRGNFGRKSQVNMVSGGKYIHNSRSRTTDSALHQAFHN